MKIKIPNNRVSLMFERWFKVSECLNVNAILLPLKKIWKGYDEIAEWDSNYRGDEAILYPFANQYAERTDSEGVRKSERVQCMHNLQNMHFLANRFRYHAFLLTFFYFKKLRGNRGNAPRLLASPLLTMNTLANWNCSRRSWRRPDSYIQNLWAWPIIPIRSDASEEIPMHLK